MGEKSGDGWNADTAELFVEYSGSDSDEDDGDADSDEDDTLTLPDDEAEGSWGEECGEEERPRVVDEIVEPETEDDDEDHKVDETPPPAHSGGRSSLVFLSKAQ